LSGRLARNAPSLALSALILGSIAIGASPSELGPTATAFHRILWAVLLLWLGVRLDQRRESLSALAAVGQTGRLALPGLLFVGDLMFWYWSILYTTIANATLFANFAPGRQPWRLVFSARAHHPVVPGGRDAGVEQRHRSGGGEPGAWQTAT
jgi:hypothetical protein